MHKSYTEICLCTNIYGVFATKFTIILILFSFSYPPRHRAHGAIPDASLRVPREGPQAVHGRLRRHPRHEQRQGCTKLPMFT